MQYLLLIMVIVFMSLQNVFQKQYNIKSEQPNVFLFGGFTSIAALLFFVVTSGFRLDFNPDFFPYSFGFGITYAMSLIGLVYAIRYGSLAISTLAISYSLLIPTLYGIMFLDEKISINTCIGILFLIVSIFLINAKKSETKFTLKWGIFILMAFLGNGFCSTFQKMEQNAMNGAYKSEFMIVALIITTLIMFTMVFVSKGKVKSELKLCAVNAMPSGIANGIVNLFVMLLTGSMPNAILFPSVSAGGIVLSFILAILVYKERLTKKQNLGYVFGIASVILLNL